MSGIHPILVFIVVFFQFNIFVRAWANILKKNSLWIAKTGCWIKTRPNYKSGTQCAPSQHASYFSLHSTSACIPHFSLFHSFYAHASSVLHTLSLLYTFFFDTSWYRSPLSLLLYTFFSTPPGMYLTRWFPAFCYENY